MEETKQRNPLKVMAIELAHQMDEEQRIYDEALPPWKEEEIREYGKYLRDEIYKRSYDIQLLMAYAERYKTLTMLEYREWIYI